MIQWVQIAFGVGALIVIYAWLSVFQRTGRAIGTVTKIVTRPVARRQNSPVPVITFKVGEKTYSFSPTLVLIGEASRAAIGTKVPVAYNPAHPTDAEIATWYPLYLPAAIATVGYAMAVYFFVRARL